jgi:hypothetical protein
LIRARKLAAVKSTLCHLISFLYITVSFVRVCHGSAAGVYWDDGKDKWASSLSTSGGGGRAVHLGWFVDEVEAALAYDQAARENHKKEAKLNFPDSSSLQHQGTTKRARGEKVRPHEGQQGSPGTQGHDPSLTSPLRVIFDVCPVRRWRRRRRERGRGDQEEEARSLRRGPLIARRVRSLLLASDL